MNQIPFNIRLKDFLEYTGLSISEFADKCLIPRPTFSGLLSGRNQKVSDKIIRQIHEAFPDLSVTWLLFGEGEMLMGSAPSMSHYDEGNKAYDGNDNGRRYGDDVCPSANFRDGENPIFPAIGADGQKYGRENMCKPDDTCVQYVDRQEETAQMMADYISKSLTENKKNERKVVRVTIYYDDGSYQTFEHGR